MNNRSNTWLIIILVSLLLISCGKEKYPTAPPPSGKVTIRNESGQYVIITRYSHNRDQHSASKTINHHLPYVGSSYSFTNLLDGNNSEIFQGGDKVGIWFESMQRDPDYPSNALFSGFWNVDIKGNTLIKIKKDGSIGQ